MLSFQPSYPSVPVLTRTDGAVSVLRNPGRMGWLRTLDTVADPQQQIHSGVYSAAYTQRRIHSGVCTAADTQRQIPAWDKQQQIHSGKYSSRYITQQTQWQIHHGRYITQQTQWQTWIYHGRYIYSGRYTARYTVPGQDTN